MDSCRTCKYASILKQQCRAEPPKAFPVLGPRGPVLFGGFPGLPPDGAGCGAYEQAGWDELERRDREHPVTVREVGEDAPRIVS